MKHTKGKWELIRYSDDPVHGWEAEYPNNILTQDHSTVIALVGADADAKLIASAPELLEALIEASNLFDNYPETLECIGTYELVQGLIKRLT
jgi:hypothetical protein